MSLMRIYFVIRGANVQDQINEAIKGKPHMVLKIGKSPLPKLGKISIKMLDIKFYPLDGKPIPLSGEKIVTFDIADQVVGDSKTGDLNIFAYAKFDGED